MFVEKVENTKHLRSTIHCFMNQLKCKNVNESIHLFVIGLAFKNNFKKIFFLFRVEKDVISLSDNEVAPVDIMKFKQLKLRDKNVRNIL